MKPEERIYTAISGKAPDRVPVVPKIWVDFGARITGTSFVEVITEPLTALRVIVDAGLVCQVDGVRQFHFPKRRVIDRDGKVFEIDNKGKLLGEIDMMGGLMTHLYNPKDFNLEESSGLGMRIVTAQLKQLAATLEVRNHQPGTEFIVEVPLRPAS